jgi:hypothetical protein
MRRKCRLAQHRSERPSQTLRVSCAATMHDAADSDSETEAVQEAATVAGAGGAGFGAENDVPPAAEREVQSYLWHELLASHALHSSW